MRVPEAARRRGNYVISMEIELVMTLKFYYIIYRSIKMKAASTLHDVENSPSSALLSKLRLSSHPETFSSPIPTFRF